MTKAKKPEHYIKAIRKKALSIYDPIEIGDPEIWIPTPVLQVLLSRALTGISLGGLPLRTRSKVLKQHICRALGYPVPSSFKRTQPRFPGQSFDTYVQKSNNLQIWNEEIAPNRRYVIIRVDQDIVISKVKVVTGENLALLDTTGTLTQKYQARLVPKAERIELITAEDTESLQPLVRQGANLVSSASPIDNPVAGQMLPIWEISERLSKLVGSSFPDVGDDQERNRGAQLHRLVCQTLGYLDYQDDGRFPDIRHQLLELKLQTSPTIDLGLVKPNSVEILDVGKLKGRNIRHCDVRYAIFYAETDGETVTITHLFLTTGQHFFSCFPLFQGKVLNKKLQIPLPGDFFNT